MKTFIFLSFLTVFSLKSFSHDYYFTFAEIELNKETSSLEVTLMINNHDVEHWLNSTSFSLLDLEKPKVNDSLMNHLIKTILPGFKIQYESKHLRLKYKGLSIKEDGNIEFYFESEKIGSITEVLITFDLLMDQYNEQQNKLIYLNGLKKETFEFLPSNITHLVKF